MKTKIEDIIPPAIAKKMVDKCGLDIMICGNSMEPTYFEGEKVHIVSSEQIIEGDIICYYNVNRYVIHRVAYVRNGLLLTKGDNNKYLDVYNPNIIVIGKVERREEQIQEQRDDYSKDFVTYVFWNKNEYKKCENISKCLNVPIVYANKTFEDGINVAISPCAVQPISRFYYSFCSIKKIYIHIGVKISDHTETGYILDSCFDFVVRSGNYLMCNYLDSIEKFAILNSEVNMVYRG